VIRLGSQIEIVTPPAEQILADHLNVSTTDRTNKALTNVSSIAIEASK